MRGKDHQKDLVGVAKGYKIHCNMGSMAIKDEEALLSPRFLPGFLVKKLLQPGQSEVIVTPARG
jgi:hypothetical protein